MRGYDHRTHAGNAGDVWKHFILLEVADRCLARGGLNYAESHVGWPDYALSVPGEWEDGVARCWRHLPDLQRFPYFEILADLNSLGLKGYPGSARLVLEAANRRSRKLSAELWDVDPDVATAWGEAVGTGFHKYRFHRGDGFSGVSSLLDRSKSGLLLVDPPHLDPQSADLAERLLGKAEDRGWVALLWEMMDERDLFEGSFERYELRFEQAGLSCGRWRGAVVSLAGADGALRQHLFHSVSEFLKIMRPREPFNSRDPMNPRD